MIRNSTILVLQKDILEKVFVSLVVSADGVVLCNGSSSSSSCGCLRFLFSSVLSASIHSSWSSSKQRISESMDSPSSKDSEEELVENTAEGFGVLLIMGCNSSSQSSKLLMAVVFYVIFDSD